MISTAGNSPAFHDAAGGEFLTEDQLRAVTHSSRTKLFRIRNSDPSFPRPVRFGRRLLTPRAEVLAWLLTRRGGAA